jgi:hypothetical protein
VWFGLYLNFVDLCALRYCNFYCGVCHQRMSFIEVCGQDKLGLSGDLAQYPLRSVYKTKGCKPIVVYTNWTFFRITFTNMECFYFGHNHLVYKYTFQHLLCDDPCMYHKEIFLLMYLLMILYIDQYGIRWNVCVDNVITYWHHSIITPNTSLHKVMFSILFGILWNGFILLYW